MTCENREKERIEKEIEGKDEGEKAKNMLLDDYARITEEQLLCAVRWKEIARRAAAGDADARTMQMMGTSVFGVFTGM